MNTPVTHFVGKILLVKLILTLFVWALPLILVPACCLKNAGLPGVEPSVFGVLLGVSYLSLAVCYYNGVLEARREEFPMTAVGVGIVSNGLSAVFLFIYLFPGFYADILPMAFVYLFCSLLLTAGICYCLIRSLIQFINAGNLQKVQSHQAKGGSTL